MRSEYDEVDDESVRGMDSRQRHKLHEILGREPENGPGNGSLIPIAPDVTNGDQWHANDPAAAEILKQIDVACDRRDEALAAYEKAKPAADAASRKAHSFWDEVRTQNTRALKLREALAALKAAK